MWGEWLDESDKYRFPLMSTFGIDWNSLIEHDIDSSDGSIELHILDIFADFLDGFVHHLDRLQVVFC